MAEIVERTDGNPLFVEEMTKAMLEAEGEGNVNCCFLFISEGRSSPYGKGSWLSRGELKR